MPVSRRGFLGRAAGASAAGVAVVSGLGGFFPQTDEIRSRCLVVSPGPHCQLPESEAGYKAALSSLNLTFQRTSFLQSLAPAGLIILPAAVTTAVSALARVRKHLANGSVVLYESGAAFLGPHEFSFHKCVIRSVFGLSLHDPVRLWDSSDSLKQSPYVDYYWPVATKVRDFSCAIPISSENGETIARFQALAVAAKLRVGNGTLVFLGSPLGPHLLNGDREASRWLRALYSSS